MREIDPIQIVSIPERCENMTEREQWEELAFFELANGDRGDPFQDGWDDPEDDEFPGGEWDAPGEEEEDE